MFQLILSILLAFTEIPTGPGSLQMRQLERSPLESRPASFRELGTVAGSRGETVLLVVADYLEDPLSAQLSQLQDDLAGEGWTVALQVMGGGSPQDLRSLLQNTPDLDGAIFIGFLPCAWYEEDYWGVEEFPCELYFMDLDGIWTDSDQDSLFDGHSGDVAPEIWVGRIDAHTAYGPEVQLLVQYLEKDHLYRTGQMGLNSRALTFNDDDWGMYTDCGLDAIYGTSGVTVVNEPGQTTAENYLDRLSQGYEFVHLMSHSCPWGHTFKVPGGMAGTVMAPEIAQVNPRTAFLQLFSCSNARWVEQGCLGNWYLYGTDYGLLVTGAAKTGSMLDFEEYYGPLGTGLTFGEAFREWWEYEAQSGFSSYERAWFYGNALLGDPTLKPAGGGIARTGLYYPGQGLDDYMQVSTSQYSDCFPAMAAAQGGPARVVTAWLSGENGRLDIAARLYQEETGWGPVIYVDPDEYWDAGVSACYHDTSPWIAWSDFEYATYSYRIKTACGPGFSQVEVQVDQEGYQVDPVLASDGSLLWLSWLDWDGQGGAVMVKTVDESFPAARISQWGSWCREPDMQVDASGIVHVVWEERSPSGSSVLWSKGGAGGFDQPQELSSGQLCSSPSLSIRPSDGALCLTWVDDAGTSSIRTRIWDGSSWGNEEEVHDTGQRISHLSFGNLPEPGEEGYVWQEGAGAEARIMALAAGSAEPSQLLWFQGPAWSPVLTEGEICWAGNGGDGWEIYWQQLSELGMEGSGSQADLHPVLVANPVRGSLTLTLPDGGSSFSSDIIIYDMAGRALMEDELTMEPGGTATVDCSGLPSGVYFMGFRQGSSPIRFLLLR